MTPEFPADLTAWGDSSLPSATPATPLQALMETTPGADAAVSVAELADVREAVADAITALRHPYYEYVLRSWLYEGLSYRQIGQRFGVSKSKAHRDVARALERLGGTLQAMPAIRERIPELKPTTWNEAALQAVEYIRVQAAVTLAAPLYILVERGKMIVQSIGWPEADDLDSPFVSNLIQMGATAFDTLTMTTEWGDLVKEVTDLLVERHQKYGPGNINEFKLFGLLVRMSDKVARIKNGSGDFADETARDSWMDLIGYAAIAYMLAVDTFDLPLVKEA